MAKKFFIVKQISKKQYLEEAAKAGKPEDTRLLNASCSGSMNIGPKTHLAYTDDGTLEVPLDEDDNDG